MTNRFLKVTAAALAAALISLPAFAADEHVAPMQNLAKSDKMAWLKDPALVAAIKEQNQKHASLSQGDVDSMDKKWRSEVKASGGSMIDGVMSNTLSAFLKKVKEQSGGLFTEIFVMDNKGLNVGQSDVTSDYWQGDEAKWKDTYGKGGQQVHIGKVDMDESTQTLQSQLSVTIVDPATNEPIGAVTVGVNVEQLN
jgi:hypothetical protein